MSNTKSYFYIIFVIFTRILFCFSEKVTYFLSSDVDFNPAHLQDHRIQINPDNVTLDIILNIPFDFKTDPWVFIGANLQNRKTNEYRPMLQYDFNVCQFLGKGRGKLLKNWMENFWKYGNLPTSCPIGKGNYSWHNFRVEKFAIPTFVPACKFEILINTYFKTKSGKDTIANVTVYGELK